MACPKSVVNCPDKQYKAHNAGAKMAVKKLSNTKTTISNQTIIDGKVYTITSKNS